MSEVDGKAYVIISGKGGVGKTTSAINLGSSMNSLGKEVIIVDANLTTPNIGLHLGSPIVPVNLNHILDNKAKPEEAIYEHESGIKIMPSSLSLVDLNPLRYKRIPSTVKHLKKIADFTILDSSAGLGDETKSAIKAADEVIVVATPEMSSITDALKAIKIAEKMSKGICGCIITRHGSHKKDMDLSTIQDMLETRILGVVPEDKAIRESHHLKHPVIYTHPRSKSAKAYNKVSRRILGPEYYKKEAKKIAGNKPSLFQRMLQNMGITKE